MTKENKDYGKSIKAKLLNLSKAEGLSYQPLLIHYMQERLLYRLAQSKYKHCFYLKGGALLYAHEQFKARPTLDIDFLGNSIANDKKIIEEAFSEICSITCERMESISIRLPLKRKRLTRTASIKASDCT